MIKTVKRTKEYEVFITSDGSEFDSNSQAESHEISLQCQSIWVVMPSKCDGRKSLEVFSSKELAKLSIRYTRKDYSYDIFELKLDKKFVYDQHTTASARIYQEVTLIDGKIKFKDDK